MKNEQIIMSERFSLMDAGIIGTTGRVIKFQDGEGKEVSMEEPEEIHTYEAWKHLGYQVQKGEKAVAKFAIWKYVPERTKKNGEEKRERMFLRNSSFFSRSQVEPIRKEA